MKFKVMQAVVMAGGEGTRLPSSEEPIINLYAEAPTKEAAAHVIQEYAEKIRTLAKT